MPYTHASVSGRMVLDQTGRLLAAFSNAWLAIAFAAAVNAGEVQVERRAS